MKRFVILCFVLCLLLPGLTCAGEDGTAGILVTAYGFGPGVSGVVLQMGQTVSAVSAEDLKVVTGGAERDIDAVYLCDAQGLPVQGSSDRLLIALSEKNAMLCPLFRTDPETGWRDWAGSCEVSVEGTLVLDGTEKQVTVQEDCMGRRICPDLDLFSVRLEHTGEALNTYTGEMETQTIRMAAYEPETLQGGDPNPLVIWLHGADEGGPVLDVAVLGNEVSLLAREKIQSHFTSGDGSVGAYVLLPQCRTVWMDEGSGENGQGTGVSRYTSVLMEAIEQYVAGHPDVDRDRIYLGGCSNGGYMTLNLLVEYPGCFAAAFPVCEAYDTAEQEQRIRAIAAQSVWFVQSADDNVVSPERYVVPTYADLVFEEAEDCWLSMFDGYRHAVWSAVFHDLVNGVQDPDDVFENMAAQPDREKGGTFTADGTANLFDWLNGHKAVR